jgi:hypothetical protein
LSRRPYCLTHLLPNDLATGDGLLGFGVAASPIHDVYPRFGYMGTMGGRNFQTPSDAAAIDNILTWYGGALGPAANATIVNTVVGKPYGAEPLLPPSVTAELTGGLSVNSTLSDPIPLPGGRDSTARLALGRTARFRQSNNFDLIRSTSDHLALAIEV